MKIDLHSHTRYSDGKLSVKEILMRAQQMQVDVLAITDHDCVDAIDEGLEYLQNQSSKDAGKSLTLLPGVEISTKWHGFEIHVLGLDIDHTNTRLLDNLVKQRHLRVERAKKIADKLAKIGIDNVFEDTMKKVPNDCVSRAHIANVLVERGICTNFQQAFTHYLGKNKKAYVATQWVDLADAVEWINDAGGTAVIAHPYHYDMTSKWLRRLVDEFSQAGGLGMEAQHPSLSKQKRDLMVSIANDFGLACSMGSDFHAPSKWTELGRHLTLPDAAVPIWTHFKRTKLFFDAVN